MHYSHLPKSLLRSDWPAAFSMRWQQPWIAKHSCWSNTRSLALYFGGVFNQVWINLNVLHADVKMLQKNRTNHKLSEQFLTYVFGLHFYMSEPQVRQPSIQHMLPVITLYNWGKVPNCNMSTLKFKQCDILIDCQMCLC